MVLKTNRKTPDALLQHQAVIQTRFLLHLSPALSSRTHSSKRLLHQYPSCPTNSTFPNIPTLCFDESRAHHPDIFDFSPRILITKSFFSVEVQLFKIQVYNIMTATKSLFFHLWNVYRIHFKKKTDFRDRGRERERKWNVDLLFHLFMHSLVDSYVPWPRIEHTNLVYLNAPARLQNLLLPSLFPTSTVLAASSSLSMSCGFSVPLLHAYLISSQILVIIKHISPLGNDKIYLTLQHLVFVTIMAE